MSHNGLPHPDAAQRIRWLAQQAVYGRWPGPVPVRVVDRTTTPLNIADLPAVADQLTLRVGDHDPWQLLWVRPRTDRPVPCLLGLNFAGNPATLAHPDVRPGLGRVLGPGHRLVASDSVPRGFDAAAWDYAASLRAGWAVATVCYGDIQEDAPDASGVRARLNATRPAGDDLPPTGAIACWAWGLCRILDGLSQLEGIDPRRIAVFGHSRLGKAALLAGAMDDRFAAVIPSQSGTGGVAPHVKRTPQAESVRQITRVFPHWFAPTYAQAADHPELIPVTPADLVRMCAPRPMLVCNAQDDLWADPEGQFEMLQEAADAWKDRGGFPAQATPMLGGRVGGRLAFFLRPGGHALTTAEWQAFLTFLTDQRV